MPECAEGFLHHLSTNDVKPAFASEGNAQRVSLFTHVFEKYGIV
jgi:hypothetical protein